MKFPDKFRIIGFELANVNVSNLSHFSKALIFNSQKNNEIFVIDDLPLMWNVDQNILSGTPDFYWEVYQKFQNFWLNNTEKNEIANFDNDRIYYPNKSHGVDMVRASGTNNYYVRLKTRTTINANNDYQDEIILYPIKLADIFQNTNLQQSFWSVYRIQTAHRLALHFKKI
ncbi:hypothetical protein ACR79S_00400 [Sphingobacterium spiritivorum]|uniref:hypothetical protein n=1 Tax=Sphingobacterium spiritivorum TaxID=258 RepID=UPI003DA1DB78